MRLTQKLLDPCPKNQGQLTGLTELVPALNRRTEMSWQWDSGEPEPDLNGGWIDLWIKHDEIAIEADRCILRISPRAAHLYFRDPLFAVISDPTLTHFVTSTCKSAADVLGSPAAAIVPDSSFELSAGWYWVQSGWSFDETLQRLLEIAPAVPDLLSMEEQTEERSDLAGFALLRWRDGLCGSPNTVYGGGSAPESLVTSFSFDQILFHRYRQERLLLTGSVWRGDELDLALSDARLLLLGTLGFRYSDCRGQASSLSMDSDWVAEYRAAHPYSPPRIGHYRFADSDRSFEALAVSHVLEYGAFGPSLADLGAVVLDRRP